MKNSVVSAALFAACGLLTAQVEGAAISLTGAAYSQNFNGLNTTGTVAWTQETNIPGWSAYTPQVNNVTDIIASSGGSATGSLFSFGPAGGGADRALGSVASDSFTGSGGFVYYVAHFQNNTGFDIDSITVDYTGEQWRLAAAQTGAGVLRVQTAVGPTVPSFTQSTTGWSAVIPSLQFTGPQVNTAAGGAAAIDGNNAANRTVIAPSTISLAVPAGQDFWVRWRDFNESGNDHGLAIDDFTMSYTVPEPASLAVIGLGGFGLLARRGGR
jgi:hypothetical protein